MNEPGVMAGTGGEFRAGFAALAGRPNVGKSTLLNALVGAKLSIVTPRPQTTRHRILGLVNLPHAQIAFVDTPGLHHGARRALNRAMNRTAASALADADVVLFVVEAGRWTAEDQLALERVAGSGRPASSRPSHVSSVQPEATVVSSRWRTGRPVRSYITRRAAASRAARKRMCVAPPAGSGFGAFCSSRSLNAGSVTRR